MPCSATCVLEVGACFSLKVATKIFFRCKKTRKNEIFDCFTKAKTQTCDQEEWSVSDTFGKIYQS